VQTATSNIEKKLPQPLLQPNNLKKQPEKKLAHTNLPLQQPEENQTGKNNVIKSKNQKQKYF
jgi:hypothetical protein